ncbi:hypothetical protein AALM99_07630 [Lactococcus muris]|uniref:Uncharacterized protein n=1 Tax=Lactococcus muris TaxID=2941330 RepID=A0ABV4D972_9LACT
MTHSDSITLLLGLKASSPLHPYFVEAGVKLSSTVRAAVFLDFKVKMSMKGGAKMLLYLALL